MHFIKILLPKNLSITYKCADQIYEGNRAAQNLFAFFMLTDYDQPVYLWYDNSETAASNPLNLIQFWSSFKFILIFSVQNQRSFG